MPKNRNFFAIAAAFLLLAQLMSIFPAAVFADGEETYTYNAEAMCDISLYPGQSHTITGVPAGSQFYSSDRLIAEVSPDGIITARSAGRVFITVCSNGAVVSRLSVYVKQKVSYITLADDSETLMYNKTFQISAKARPLTAADTSLVYTSSNPSVATVNQNGVVRAVGEGTAVITVAAADGCGAKAQFTVTAVTTRVYLNTYYVPIKQGSKFRIRSSVSTIHGGIWVKYSSSDPSVATVSSDGCVTAIAPGTAEIYATSSDGRSTRTLTVHCDSAITAQGIDISRYNGDISVSDWKKVMADGYDYVIMRAGYGREVEQMDVKFEQNYKNAREAGIDVGVYHYSYAKTTAQAEKEAEVMLQWLAGKELDYPIYYDVEDDSQSILGTLFLSSIIEAYCSKLEAAGYEVEIYSSAYLLQNYMYRSVLDKRGVWMAHIETDDPHSLYTGEYTMWQFCHKGRVSGLEGDVDLNVCYKTYE